MWIDSAFVYPLVDGALVYSLRSALALYMLVGFRGAAMVRTSFAFAFVMSGDVCIFLTAVTMSGPGFSRDALKLGVSMSVLEFARC